MCPEAAVKCVEDLCEKDLITLFIVDETGGVIKVDPNILKEVKKGVVDSQFKIAEIYLNNKLYRHAKAWCIKLSERQHVPAQIMIGKLYTDQLLGLYGANAINSAEKWFDKAYQNDPKNISLHLGLYFYEEKGKGSMAFKWFMKGALMGDYISQYWVGKFYNGELYSSGVEIDEIKAMEWFAKSADQGYQESIEKMHQLNMKGYYLMSKIKEKQKP